MGAMEPERYSAPYNDKHWYVTELLSELNAAKATGPYELSNLLLKNVVKEISSFLKLFMSTLFRPGNCPMNGSRLM